MVRAGWRFCLRCLSDLLFAFDGHSSVAGISLRPRLWNCVFRGGQQYTVAEARYRRNARTRDEYVYVVVHRRHAYRQLDRRGCVASFWSPAYAGHRWSDHCRVRYILDPAQPQIAPALMMERTLFPILSNHGCCARLLISDDEI